MVINPSVFGELSSLATYAAEPYPFGRLRDPIKRVFDALGPQRPMWRSDAYKDWILGRTAETVLQWPVEAELEVKV